MAQAGYTPIQLYYSTTASAIPTAGNLAAGELALNTLDEKLYFKNSSGVVKLLASTAGTAGTVSTVSVTSANGLAGTVLNPTTTPAITLSTTVTGVLKGNGTAISAAVSGTDYAPATSGTSILKGNNLGGFANAVSGSDYAPAVPITTGILKGNNLGGFNVAVSGTDFAPPTSGTNLLAGNNVGGFSNISIGSGLNLSAGTLSATGSGGTVQSVSVSSANGFSGSVLNPTTTPAITLSTSVSGVLKGSAGSIVAATSGVDYAPPTSGTSILYGNNLGGFSNVAIGSGLNFNAGTLTATGSGGSVTSVSVVSGNGFAGTVATPTTTPAITLSTTITGLLKGNGTAISAAVSGTDYAPATSGSSVLKGNAAGGFSNASSGVDFAPPTSGTSILYGNNAGGFNNVAVGPGLSFSAGTLSATGGTGTVTSVGVSFSSGLISVSNSPVTGSGTIALTVAGTSGGIPYFTSTNAWASSGALAANALVIGGGAGGSPATTTTGTGVLTALGTSVGSAGAFVVNGGALGTPSSGTVTNLTGTASININGTVGATTPNTGAFTSVTSTSGSGVLTRAAATQDGVAIVGRAGGASSFTSTLTPTTLTASRTLTLPDNSGTILTTGTPVTVPQGGTGLTTLTANNVILGNGTSTPQFVAPGTLGNVLTSTGSTWSSQAAPAGNLVLVNYGAFPSAASVLLTGIGSAYKRYIVFINAWGSPVTNFLPEFYLNSPSSSPVLGSYIFSTSTINSNSFVGGTNGAGTLPVRLNYGATAGSANNGGYSFVINIDAQYATSLHPSMGTYFVQGTWSGSPGYVGVSSGTIMGNFSWQGGVTIDGIYLQSSSSAYGSIWLYAVNTP